MASPRRRETAARPEAPGPLAVSARQRGAAGNSSPAHNIKRQTCVCMAGSSPAAASEESGLRPSHGCSSQSTLESRLRAEGTAPWEHPSLQATRVSVSSLNLALIFNMAPFIFKYILSIVKCF